MIMRKPIIFIIDDDPQVLQAVSRDVKAEYRKDYKIMATESAQEALDSLADLKNKGEAVALFLTDQRMPEMLGVEFLAQAKAIFSDAKSILLTAYSDIEAAIKAINDVQLDYYLLKPWDPPEEKLYPILKEHLDEWHSSFRPPFQGIKVIGYQWSPKSHAIKDFLSGNLIPYQYLDIETQAEANDLLELNHLSVEDLPVVFFDDGSWLTDPDMQAVGQKIGLKSLASKTMYDVAIIGAGPAGLAAAVYGGSEGLNTILIEKRAPGGQAGTSSRIENYLGFPNGLSGAELSRRAITQATRFGIEFLSPAEVNEIQVQDNYKILKMADGNQINARSIVITTGVDYRKLSAKGINDFTGAGIYYGAATTEANACRGKDVYIVGGGNSAGQAAMYLSKFANKVYIVIRKPDLTSSMSAYLIKQIDQMKNVEVLPFTEVIEAKGKDKLASVVLQNTQNQSTQECPAGALLIFIGARPYTDWITLDILKNEKGFLQTGTSLSKNDKFKRIWTQTREPYLLETSHPGVFAAGDVRAGAMNRVASAVGEGAMAIKFVHQYLAEN